MRLGWSQVRVVELLLTRVCCFCFVCGSELCVFLLWGEDGGNTRLFSHSLPTTHSSCKLDEKYKTISEALRVLQELQLKITGNAKECEKEIDTQIEGIIKEIRSYKAMLIKQLHAVKEGKLGETGKRVGEVKNYLKTLSQVSAFPPFFFSFFPLREGVVCLLFCWP